MATTIRIRCDGCGRETVEAWKNAGGGIAHIRHHLEAESGWVCRHSQQRDWCPACVAAGKAPKPKAKK